MLQVAEMDSTIYSITWCFLPVSFTQRGKFFRISWELSSFTFFLDSLLSANSHKIVILFVLLFNWCWNIMSGAEFVRDAKVASHSLHFCSLLICWMPMVSQKAQHLVFLDSGELKLRSRSIEFASRCAHPFHSWQTGEKLLWSQWFWVATRCMQNHNLLTACGQFRCQHLIQLCEGQVGSKKYALLFLLITKPRYRSQLTHNSCSLKETWEWQQTKIYVSDQLKITEERKLNYNNSIHWGIKDS